MKADEATEFMDAEKPEDRFKQRCAVLIAFFAMLLAVTGLGGQNATKDAMMNNVLASNYFNFYQAKNMRQTALVIAANEIELAWANEPALAAEAKTALAAKLADYRKMIARYETEPQTGEGKKELLERAKQHESARDHAMRQDPYFDYAEALLQIAIVLVSVSIISEVLALALLGGGLGLIGGLLMLNGFLLVIEIPWLG